MINIMREILRVVTSKGDTMRLLPELNDNNDDATNVSLTALFLNGIRSGRWSDDEQAALDLYGTDSSDQRFRTLKSRIYERLVHSILFLQVKQPEHSEYLASYYKCTRNLLCAQSLRRFAAMGAAQHIAHKTLLVAQKYQFTEICLSLCKLLGEIATLSGKRRDFYKYSGMASKHLQELVAEYTAEELLDKWHLETKYTAMSLNKIMADSETVFNRIGELYEKHPTHLMRLNWFRARKLYAESIDDYALIIRVSEEAVEYLDSNPHLAQRARYGEFLFSKMMCCLSTRQYDEAYIMAEKCVSYFTSGGRNWYSSVEMAFISAMHLEEYDKALYFYNLATQHENWENHPEPTVREHWITAHAYLLLAGRLGLHNLEIPNQQSFRLTTYLNSIPEEQKSKKYFNVLIHVSHVFFLILQGDFDAAEKRVEYLKVYSSRWLRDPDLLRVRIFLRLLNNLPRFSFDPRRIRTACRPLFEELRKTSEESISASEYIPFEVMYERLLDVLERQSADLEV